jgi:hypothetical protein
MADIFLYHGAPAPNDVILRDPTQQGYWGTLKRWTGATWVKAKLKVAVGGNFVLGNLKKWSGAAWQLVDTTGV